MTPEEISAVLNTADSYQLQALHMAHWRYMSLAGIVADVLSAEVVDADQKAYPHFIKRISGLAVFNDADCVTFMTEITGLAPEPCEAWKNYDYYDLHGETAHQTAARQMLAG